MRMTEELLPNAEMEVLACLWQQEQATVRQIREAMQSYRPMTHGSVFTLLRRLEDKQMVSREKGPSGKALIFKPIVRPGSTHRRVVRSLVDRIFGGSGVALVASLFETSPPTREEIRELQQLLNKLRRTRTTKGPQR
jgi:BlaI family penicillinase repressor